MLEQIFMKVIDMSRAASMVIVVVFIVRFLLKKFPKYISYMLWSVVLFRLLCPVTLESGISLVPNLKPAFQEYISEKDVVLPEYENEVSPKDFFIPNIEDEIKNELKNELIVPTGAYLDERVKAEEVSWQTLFISYGKYIWITGLGILFLYCVMSVVSIYNKVSTSILLKENIYIIDKNISPFVMGIINPRIYLPGCLSKKEQEYIILHEKFHIKRFDYIIKPMAFIALCIHWFNPLVWIAFIFFCKDMEMSCDEAVIRRMGETVKADYSASLLALSTQRRIICAVPVDFGEGNTKERVRNLAALRKTKKGIVAILIIGVVILIVCLACTRKTLMPDSNIPEDEGEISVVENHEILDEPEEPVQLNVSLDITDYYVTKTGSPIQLYYIDENNVLWGSGGNEYGQLGQGTQDYEYHNQRVKIAENVAHVDYSQTGFAIYLTADNKLYGMGNAGCGALQQHDEFDWWQRVNGEHDVVTTPILLMEDVVYASCGRDDIAVLKEDGSVWIWGTIYAEGNYASHNVYFLAKPKKILENAVLVTGGWFNHAALLQDGTVWTWGYNSAGNCGVADLTVLNEPTKVAEGVVMVWTNLAVDGYPQPDVDTIALAWTGNQKYTVYDDISEFDDVYPRLLNNTVIQKADGSYWVCGENVGTEEKVVYGAESNYSVICTHEFHLCE